MVVTVLIVREWAEEAEGMVPPLAGAGEDEVFCHPCRSRRGRRPLARDQNGLAHEGAGGLRHGGRVGAEVLAHEEGGGAPVRPRGDRERHAMMRGRGCLKAMVGGRYVKDSNQYRGSWLSIVFGLG